MSDGASTIGHAYQLADGLITHLGVIKSAGGVPRRDELARAMLPLARLAARVDDMGQRLADLAASAVPESIVSNFDPARFAGPESYELRAALRPVTQTGGPIR